MFESCSGVLSKQTGSKDREDTGGVSSSKPTGGYYSDPDFEAHFKKDTDWFSTYISHLRKRRRKAVRGSGLAGDEESDDDRSLIGGARSAFEKPKRKTFYEQQLVRHFRYSVSFFNGIWTNFLFITREVVSEGPKFSFHYD